jgi:eukaryotic-like serine/threonine-protein kinase
MRVCSMCGEAYAESVEYCEIHGVALSSWEDEATRIAGTGEQLEPPSWEMATPGAQTQAEIVPPWRTGDGDGAQRDAVSDDEETARLGKILGATAPAGAEHAVPGRGDTHDDSSSPAMLPPPPQACVVRDSDYEWTRVAAPRAVATPPRATSDTPGARVSPGAIAVGEEPRQDRVLADRYHLGRRIAVGGFGAVFDARDLRLDKRVTVKVLSPYIAHDRDSLAQFRRDAAAASRIGHQNIATITDFDLHTDGTSFVVMDLLEGCDLKQLIHDVGALPPQRALPIAIQIANALEAAHRAGIVHRDLKPAAVFILRPGALGDLVRVIDFGISRVMGQRAAKNGRPGDVMGSPSYMAPERLEGAERGDERTDVYSLGVLLYEMLVGAPPFAGDDYRAIAAQHRTGTPEPPSARRVGLPRSLDAVVLRALAKKPDDRHRSMAQLSTALLDELRRIDPAAAALHRHGEAAAPAVRARRPKYTTTEPVWPPRRPGRSAAMRTHRRRGGPGAADTAALRSRPWLVVAVGGLLVAAIVGAVVAIL